MLHSLLFTPSRFNYKVNEVFRELMGCPGPGGNNMGRIDCSQNSRDKDKCNIL